MRFVLHLIKTPEEKRAIDISFVKRENIREIWISAYMPFEKRNSKNQLAPV